MKLVVRSRSSVVQPSDRVASIDVSTAIGGERSAVPTPDRPEDPRPGVEAHPRHPPKTAVRLPLEAVPRYWFPWRGALAQWVGGALLGLVVAVGGGASAWPLHALLGAVSFGVAWWTLESERRRALRARAAAIPYVSIVPATAGQLPNALDLVLERATSAEVLLRLDRPIGLTLVASASRDILTLAITHRDGVVYLGGGAPSGMRFAPLLERTVAVPVSDLPDVVSVRFAEGDNLLALTAALEDCAPGSLDRVLLSDASMGDLVLAGSHLRAGATDFDLSAPLSFRSFAFHERSLFGAHAFQATWVGQGGREITLVSLSSGGDLGILPSSTPPFAPGVATTSAVPLTTGSVAIQRAIARDLRLARDMPEPPPPKGMRVAMDRLFLPRIRLALALAPGATAATRVETPPLDASTPLDNAADSRPTS